jgi:hypothetical protein
MAKASGRDKLRTEEIEVQATQLVDRVLDLAREGTVRRVIIRDQDGKALLEVPLTAGALLGSALVLMAPRLAALSAMAALLTRVTIEIVRASEEPEPNTKRGLDQDTRTPSDEVEDEGEGRDDVPQEPVAQEIPMPTEPPLTDDAGDEAHDSDEAPEGQGTD